MANSWCRSMSNAGRCIVIEGGEGAGKMYDIIQEFQRTGFNGRLIVIAGRNKRLETKLKKEAGEFGFPLEAYGFTDKVHELMGESDLIITKAGPGTIAEALAMSLPIIITSWLPGQEEGNVEFVVRQNVGRVSEDPQRVVELANELRDKNRFKEILNNIKRVSRPQASIEIAREIFRYL